jgi:hypothetical protein
VLETPSFLEVGKILFVENLVGEKRRERLHIGESRNSFLMSRACP